MRVDLEEERRRSLERQGVHEVGEPPSAREKVLGDQRAARVEPYIVQLRQDLLGTDEPRDPEVGGVLVHDSAAPWSKKVADLALATGFRESDLRNWIIYGRRPVLHPVVFTVRPRRERLPDGSWIRHRAAVVTFNVPVTEEHVRRLYREHLRDLWDQPLGEFDQKGPDVTDLDYHLLSIVRDHPEATTWAQRLAIWRATPPGGYDPTEWQVRGKVGREALRYRWSNLPNEIKAMYTPTTTED